ncbi:MAG: hypothetical protein V3S24_14140, partial [Candidatus Tectomicrobia bacterium]
MAAPVAHAQTIKLGVLTPLSVPGDANAGKLISRGARLGAEYVNTVMGGIRGGEDLADIVERHFDLRRHGVG